MTKSYPSAAVVSGAPGQRSAQPAPASSRPVATGPSAAALITTTSRVPPSGG